MPDADDATAPSGDTTPQPGDAIPQPDDMPRYADHASGPSEEQIARLHRVISACPWLSDVLGVVDEVGTAAGLACWVGAGAVRDTLWDAWYGPVPDIDPALLDGSHVADVDVVFFDGERDAPAVETRLERTLTARRPAVRWDVTNQAGVHRWYERRFGLAVAPLRSLAEGIGTWPETATAVAVRRTAGSTLEVIAPLGLGDLLDGIIRRNPRRVTEHEYRRRLVRKRPANRWPAVRVHTC